MFCKIAFPSKNCKFKACVEKRRTEYVTLLDSTLHSKLFAVKYNIVERFGHEVL